MSDYTICIIKPNKSAFSETFIDEHIKGLSGNKRVIYGGAFPLYDHNDKLLIRSTIGLLIYVFQKRILKQKEIAIRTNALVKYFRREKIDVVFTEYGMVGAMVTEACKSVNIPLIIHFHGADIHHTGTREKYMALYKKAFAYCSAIISVSGDMTEALKTAGAASEKISYIPCGVDTTKFTPVDSLPNKRNFLSVGRFVEKKSPMSVIKAFKKVLQVLPDSLLWMVGDGPLFKEVEEYISEHNLGQKITLTGIQDQDRIKSLIRNSNCFVQHSVTAGNGDMEGSPVTIIEASASGLPVVSTRHAGIKEAVIDGVTGFLVDEYDIDGMAERMIEVVSDPEKAFKMGQAGRLHILENYAIDKQVSKLNSVIQDALNNSRM